MSKSYVIFDIADNITPIKTQVANNNDILELDSPFITLIKVTNIDIPDFSYYVCSDWPESFDKELHFISVFSTDPTQLWMLNQGITVLP